MSSTLALSVLGDERHIARQRWMIADKAEHGQPTLLQNLKAMPRCAGVIRLLQFELTLHQWSLAFA